MKQHDDSSKGSFKSDGRRIDDHSFWAGKAGKDMVLPMGVHTKSESSARNAGDVDKYLDKTEVIKKVQDGKAAKIKGHQGKLPEYRN